MKITYPQFRTIKDWIPESITRVLRDYPKEIAIAFGLAIVAAIVVDPIYKYHESRLRQQALQDNLKAVATLEVFDSRNQPIGQGSGFFISPTGILVTNFHVIKGAGKVFAHVPSGAFYVLRTFVANENEDIAILQFDASETPSIRGFGDSDSIEVGDEVFAVGTPKGLEATYSTGTVSNPSRNVDGRTLIQFSAPISPGSSGGGLFDLNGEAIGITAASQNIKAGPQAGLAQNLNFAVPINRVKNMLNPEAGYELQKESPGYYYSLGTLADNKRQWDKAIQLYTKALSVDPDYRDAYTGLAWDYYEKGNYELEVSNFEQAAARGPEKAETWYFLGTAYQDVGDYDKAIIAFNKALNIDPNHKDALHDLAIIYISTGDTEKARQLLQRLMNVDKGWGNQIQLLIKRVER
jgi:hypothetical protein